MWNVTIQEESTKWEWTQPDKPNACNKSTKKPGKKSILENNERSSQDQNYKMFPNVKPGKELKNVS